MPDKPPSITLTARDCLSTLRIEADMDNLHIEYRAGEGMGGGRWEYVDGDLGIDRIYELHAFLSQMIDIYEMREREREEAEAKRD